MAEKYMYSPSMLEVSRRVVVAIPPTTTKTTHFSPHKHQHSFTKYSHSTIYIVTKCSMQGKAFVLLNYNYIKAFRIQ